MTWAHEYQDGYDQYKKPFESRKFTQENLNAWRLTIHQELMSKPHALHEAIRYATQQGKYRRARINASEFTPLTTLSIISAVDLTGQLRWVVPSPFVAGEAGDFGVVKIAFLIIETANYYVIDFKYPVALKIIYNKSVSQEQIKQSAYYWQQLHPYAAIAHQALPSVDYDTKQYLLLPLIRGNDLTEFIGMHVFPDGWQHNSATVSFLQKIKISQAIIAALEKLHQRHIINADLKPENIMLTLNADGSFHAEDIDLDNCFKFNDVITDRWIGTPDYMPPEFISAKNNSQPLRLLPSYDIFSLGVVIAELFIDSADGGISVSRSQLLQRAPLRSAIRKLDTILPDVDNLDRFNWQASYFSPDDKTEIYAAALSKPLITILKSMMQADPTRRPQLQVIKRMFDMLFYAANKPDIKYRSYCKFITPMVPSAPVIQVKKKIKNLMPITASKPTAVTDDLSDKTPLLASGDVVASTTWSDLVRRRKMCALL